MEIPEGLTDLGDGLFMDENGNIIQGRDLFVFHILDRDWMVETQM